MLQYDYLQSYYLRPFHCQNYVSLAVQTNVSKTGNRLGYTPHAHISMVFCCWWTDFGESSLHLGILFAIRLFEDLCLYLAILVCFHSLVALFKIGNSSFLRFSISDGNCSLMPNGLSFSLYAYFMTASNSVLYMNLATRSLVLCLSFVDRCLSFSTFSFSYCVVCSSSSIYGF